jgi:hypothetical protein
MMKIILARDLILVNFSGCHISESWVSVSDWLGCNGKRQKIFENPKPWFDCVAVCKGEVYYRSRGFKVRF